jgi:zinc protease
VKLQLPLCTRVLSNGLTVVVSENHEMPVFGLCVLYRIGSRLEPPGRAGFAHLFEHLMFEGTPRAPKGVFDRVCEASGGTNNGQTRADVTLYMETAPSAALDRFLWLEADRMSSLAFSEETLANQREVVKEEIRVNVKNDPYGLFEYSELPRKTFEKWENAHDGYGDLVDLDAATLDDVVAFFAAYYRPNNAVLVVTGDVATEEVFGKSQHFFGAIPAAPVPPCPDLNEPKRQSPVIAISKAPLANTPALAAGWRMPPRDHPDVWPLVVLGELLHGGRASRLYRGLVEGREMAAEVWGSFNPFQSWAWYEGTTLFLSKIAYKRGVPASRLLGALAEEIGRVAARDVAREELERVKTRMLAGLFGSLEARLDLAVELAQSTAFEGGPGGLLEIPGRIQAVTPEDLSRAAAWLTPEACAVVVKEPPGEACEEER